MTGIACRRMIALSVLLGIAAPLFSHGGGYRKPGGIYRGPGDTVGGAKPHTPRSPGAPGPTTPGPSAPGAPSPSGPTTPGPSAPGGPVTGGPKAPTTGGAGPRTGPRGMPIGEDFSRWQTFWEFNKDRFLNLKDAIHAPLPVTGSDDFYMGTRRRVDSGNSLKPSDTDIQTVILPTLRNALANTDNRDITSSCLMALAKIGRDHNSFAILPILQKHLVTHDQEIRETAALAMGLTQMGKALVPLRDLALDTEAGRKLIERAKVDYRTRSFALYGLALVAYGNEDLDLKRKVFEVAQDVLTKDESRSGNVFVAAIHAAGLLRIDGQSTKANALRSEVVSVLNGYFVKNRGPSEEYMQSHVPGAIGRLLGRGDSVEHRKLKELYVAVLRGKLPGRRKPGNNIIRSATLALGQLALADKRDKAVHDALQTYALGGKDAQARYFAMIALGQVGSDTTRTVLLKILAKGNKSVDRPWAALSLGIASFRAAKNNPRFVPDATVGEAITKQFVKVRNPAARAAFAIALGLCKYKESGAELQKVLQRQRHQDEFAGYLCIGLSLMDYRRSLPLIHDLVETSVRRPGLLRQAATALGKMGDKRVAKSLMRKLEERDSNLAKLAAVSSALGYIGDRRTIAPLKKMLHNEKLTQLTRAFAAVALGMVADKERLPWNAKIAANMNYRAAVETLTQSGTGVLDIL